MISAINIFMRIVFVPYRGIYFLYAKQFKRWVTAEVVFVPYRGIYFLYPVPYIPLSKCQKQFSSPIGESTFSTRSGSLKEGWEWCVFVPYRGIYFLYRWQRKFFWICGSRFSSPIGESTFSTSRKKLWRTGWSTYFRPLSGNLLSLQVYATCKGNL